MIWIGQLVSLALVLGSVSYFHAEPRVLLFAFIMSTVANTLQIKLFLHLGGLPRFRSFVKNRTRAPSAAEREWARNYIGLENAATTATSVLMMVGGLSLFAFLLAHVDRHKELSFQLGTFVAEMAFAAALTAIYVAESLVLRETAIDFEESEAMNLHFGSQRITALALAVLLAGAGIAFLQSSGKEISAWVVMGPLIVLKHGFEAKLTASRS